MEQEFQIKKIEDKLPELTKADLVEAVILLQKQVYLLQNNVSNLVKQWPNHPPITEKTGKLETSSENKT